MVSCVDMGNRQTDYKPCLVKLVTNSPNNVGVQLYTKRRKVSIELSGDVDGSIDKIDTLFQWFWSERESFAKPRITLSGLKLCLMKDEDMVREIAAKFYSALKIVEETDASIAD